MLLKGIDVSQWQDEINWKKIKQDNIDFCILREGYRNSIDKYFLTYTKEAKEAEVPIHGVYHFCYSTNTNQVLKQAKTCISNVKKAGLDKNIIIFFDFEYDTVQSAAKKGITLDRQDCIAFTNTFCDYIVSQGYQTGVYCNIDYYENMYDTNTLYKYGNFWLAQYNNKPNPKYTCRYHQYSNAGEVAGIDGTVDLDYCYYELVDSNDEFKTDFTKYYGKISNSGHDENGGAYGGKAGDNTSTEWEIRDWYDRPWDCILRYPNQQVGNLIAELAIEAANNNLIGYDQWQRDTYWQHLKASNYRPSQITIACEADCSAGIIANTKAVGYLLNISALKNINATYTGNMKNEFKKAGFQVLTDNKYLHSYEYLKPGDILLNEVHHTATYIGQKFNKFDLGSNITTTPTTEIQKMLNAIGNYGLAIDNDFGYYTTQAVKDIQTKYGLEVDGIVGKQTLNKIKELYQNLNKKKSGYNKTIKRNGIVTAKALYVRSKPGVNNDPIKSVPVIYKDQIVGICDEIILDNKQKWYYIKVNNVYGFSSATYIK